MEQPTHGISIRTITAPMRRARPHHAVSRSPVAAADGSMTTFGRKRRRAKGRAGVAWSVGSHAIAVGRRDLGGRNAIHGRLRLVTGSALQKDRNLLRSAYLAGHLVAHRPSPIAGEAERADGRAGELLARHGLHR